jgi:hypothetical protein
MTNTTRPAEEDGGNPDAGLDAAVEINRLRNVIQAACTGGLHHMLVRWIELFPDAPVPTVQVASNAFIQSVRALCVAARTTGGTAGRDPGLCTALDRVEAMLTSVGLAPGAAAAAPSAIAALQAVVDFIEGKPDAPEPFGMVRAALANATQAKPIVYVNRQGFRNIKDVVHPRQYAQMERWMQLYYMPLFADPEKDDAARAAQAQGGKA